MARVCGSSRPPALTIPAPEDFGDFELAPRSSPERARPAMQALAPRSPASGGSLPANASVVGFRSGPASAASPGLRVSSKQAVKSTGSSGTRSVDLTDDPDSQTESPFQRAGDTG
uniref:Uncharacterized protein n=1 Tax=Cafeteria roenbergensis TaxID=33653 RepID=A0A7S0JWC8_CAFRO|mmetsp:Transcript_18900/g.72066  ORF Transcript_18900/g.72066 Transcript_18900/m.72066 type:complete len:115 (+) Transcript_18900:368-712(+)